MAEVTFNVTPATPQKRPYEYDECAAVQPSTNTPNTISLNNNASRDASPAPSSSSSLTELTNVDITTPKVKSSTSTVPPAKKPKLSFLENEAEKAAKQRERDERAKAKAGEKAKKDEDKARKDEERRKVNEEREATRRAKDLEKAEKQKEKEEKQKEKDAKKQAEQQKKDAREAEKLKKERAQMRLGAFFGKPKPEATPPSTPDDIFESISSRRSSIASIDMETPIINIEQLNRPANPDFEKFFLPFHVPEHTDLAPNNRFKLGKVPTFEVTDDTIATQFDLREQFGRPQKRLRKTVPVKEMMRNIQATGLDVVDLEGVEDFKKTVCKYLHFREDVRPPYHGTYTRVVSTTTTRKIAQNPFVRALPETNYDYDSEAEWEPPGEDDEDLENDDEMSVADDNEEEMNDFLDDADDAGRRKGPIIDMEPISSGLCWVGESFDDNGHQIQQYVMNTLHDSTSFPIDPYSTKHWIDETKPKPIVKSEATTSMPPPRAALSSLSPNAVPAVKQELGIDGKPLPIQQKPVAVSNKKPLKLIEPEFMSAFKQAIDGNDMTKAGLIEVLKKQFPKCSKDAIKDTLGHVAVRVGKKESEKTWQLVTDS